MNSVAENILFLVEVSLIARSEKKYFQIQICNGKPYKAGRKAHGKL